MRLHHVGVKTADVRCASLLLSHLGFSPLGEVFECEEYGLRMLLMLGGEREVFLELFESISDKSPIGHSRFGLHHIGLELESGESLETLCRNGLRLVNVMPALVFEGRSRALFYMSSDGLLVEVVE